MPAADLEVALVVAGGDLERARPELGIHVVVGDDRQPPTHQRQDGRLADQARVALIRGVHRDGGVGQHRLGPHGGHGDRPGPRLERVVDHVERVLHGPLLDLEVRDRGAQARVPVDHVVVAVDELLLVQVHEHLGDRSHVVVVHREALVLVVERRAQLAELARDVVAVLLHPLPDALDERLATDLLARAALGLELLLDDALGRDSRVVLPVDPLGALPAHARDPDLEVLDRRVQRVSHVQVARHVRRRHGDRVVLVRRPLGLRMEDPGLAPSARTRAALRRRARSACAPRASSICPRPSSWQVSQRGILQAVASRQPSRASRSSIGAHEPRGETRPTAACCHPDIEWHWSAPRPGARSPRARRDRPRTRRSWTESWDELVIEPEGDPRGRRLTCLRPDRVPRCAAPGSGVYLEAPGRAPATQLEDGLDQAPGGCSATRRRPARRFLAGDRPESSGTSRGFAAG